MSQLFASALHLNIRDVRALKITDPYSLHRVIYSLFTDIRSSEAKQHTPSGLVYADQGGDARGRKVLILSNRAPLTAIDGQYGEVVTKTVDPSFWGHQHYQFSVQVNPVRKDSQTGKRIAVIGREAISAWFCERAVSSWGFQANPHQLQVNKIEVQQFPYKNGAIITLNKAHIQGTLTVTNPIRFAQSFQQGIGKGRAFGCGLLQIIPLLDNPFL
ncbi:MAG: type I-E CRISPR-associated protein Cas6/Cse3/CasE [Ferrimonas sp.]